MKCICPSIAAKPSIECPIAVAVAFRKVVLAGLVLAFAIEGQVQAQTIRTADDGTVLKEIIIFGRHSIRSSTSAPSALNQFSADPYPAFSGTRDT